MSNFLARCAAIGLVGSGFAATGDLGWLAARGMRLINARTVPSEPSTAPADGQNAAATAPGRERAASASRPADPFRGPGPRPAADQPPPAGGPAQVDLAGLRPGDRLTVWAGVTTTGHPSLLAFDIVDPEAGQALLIAPGMAARRVTIRPAGDHRGSAIAKGEAIVVTPAGPSRHASTAAPVATFGPITAITIGRR